MQIRPSTKPSSISHDLQDIDMSVPIVKRGLERAASLSQHRLSAVPVPAGMHMSAPSRTAHGFPEVSRDRALSLVRSPRQTHRASSGHPRSAPSGQAAFGHGHGHGRARYSISWVDGRCSPGAISATPQPLSPAPPPPCSASGLKTLRMPTFILPLSPLSVAGLVFRLPPGTACFHPHVRR
jgi:hypothetical protein